MFFFSDLAFSLILIDNVGMRSFLTILLCFFCLAAFAKLPGHDLFRMKDTFYNPNKDYSRFAGRVTDRDSSSNILKISTENLNIKFFRAGDEVEFMVGNGKDEDNESARCIGHIRDVDKSHFVLFVNSMAPCWGSEEYFRRGTRLLLFSKPLAKRVKKASEYRELLLNKREKFFRQLNEINNNVASYEQERLNIAALYDEKMVEVQKHKQRALDNHRMKHKDHIVLQQELIKRLNILNEDLDYYLIEKEEVLKDRWSMDHDLGLPIGVRPQKMKVKR